MPKEYVLSEDNKQTLETMLLNYRRAHPSITAQTLYAIRRQAQEMLLAGGEVKLVHRPDSGFSIEMSLPKVKKRVKGVLT